MTTIQLFPVNNSIKFSLFDIYTTTYFLSPHSMLEEHAPAKEEGDPENEL